MDDFISSVKAYLFDRMTSPFIGAYFFSWLAFNLKLMVVLFSAMDPNKKNEFIDGYFSFGYDGVLHIWVYPLVAAIVYVFALPYPSRWALKYTLEQNKKNVALRQKIEEETPMSEEAAAAFRQRIKTQVKELESEVASLEAQLAALRSEQKVIEAREKELEQNIVALNRDNGILEEDRENISAQLSEKLSEATQLASSRDELLASLDSVKRELESYQELYDGPEKINNILRLVASSPLSANEITTAISKMRKREGVGQPSVQQGPSLSSNNLLSGGLLPGHLGIGKIVEGMIKK